MSVKGQKRGSFSTHKHRLGGEVLGFHIRIPVKPHLLRLDNPLEGGQKVCDPKGKQTNVHSTLVSFLWASQAGPGPRGGKVQAWLRAWELEVVGAFLPCACKRVWGPGGLTRKPLTGRPRTARSALPVRRRPPPPSSSAPSRCTDWRGDALTWLALHRIRSRSRRALPCSPALPWPAPPEAGSPCLLSPSGRRSGELRGGGQPPHCQASHLGRRGGGFAGFSEHHLAKGMKRKQCCSPTVLPSSSYLSIQ